MSLTFIDTNKIPHAKLPGSGEFAEILNDKLCGAEECSRLPPLAQRRRKAGCPVRQEYSSAGLLDAGRGHHHARLQGSQRKERFRRIRRAIRIRSNQAVRHGPPEAFPPGSAAPAELSSIAQASAGVFVPGRAPASFSTDNLRLRISDTKGRPTMSILNKWLRTRSTFLLLVAGAILLPVAARAQLKQPLLSDDNLKRVSDHVSVIGGLSQRRLCDRQPRDAGGRHGTG